MSVGPVVRDTATAAFFDGTSAGQFLLRRCPAGHMSEPAVAQCTTCAATDLVWAAAGGGATLVSWAVSYGRAGVGEPPTRTVLVIGELDEGPWWWAQLAEDLDPESAELAPGRRLRIDFQRPDNEHEWVPVFLLA
jgi:uncharacterized OB-fold protein